MRAVLAVAPVLRAPKVRTCQVGEAVAARIARLASIRMLWAWLPASHVLLVHILQLPLLQAAFFVLLASILQQLQLPPMPPA